MKKTKKTAYSALMAALLCLCAWISIPFGAQPFTMQTFGVYVAAGLLGAKGAVTAVGVYILLGALGLPVFSAMQGGMGVILGNTGGYMVGFVFIALIVGWVSDKFGKSSPSLIAAMALGTAVCYAFGTAWFMAVYASGSGDGGLLSVLMLCVFPFIVPDVAKMLLALVVIKRLGKHI